MKKLGDLERKIHYKDLMDIIKTGLKIYKMVEGRVSRIKVSDTPITNSEEEKAESESSEDSGMLSDERREAKKLKQNKLKAV